MFADNLWQSHGFAFDMLKDLRTYFKYYCETLHCDKKFVVDIEEKLIL